MSQEIHASRLDTAGYSAEAARIADFWQILKTHNHTSYGPTLAVVAGICLIDLVDKGVSMTVVCSWCRQEGRAGVVREKAPFEDRRETHGICTAHRSQVRASWDDFARSMQLSETPAVQETNGYIVRSAVGLWTSLRNLSRKAGL